MKYNTPKQRMKIYQKMIEAIDGGELFYMCHFIHKITGTQNTRVIERYFPELWEMRPKGEPYEWYLDNARGMRARKRKLLKAIELCKI